MECLIKVLLILSFVALHSVGLYWVRGRTSYRKIPWSLEALKLDVIMFVSLWNLTGGAAEIPVKSKSDWKSPTRIIRFRDFTRSCGKTSVCLVNRSQYWSDCTTICWESIIKGHSRDIRLLIFAHYILNLQKHKWFRLYKQSIGICHLISLNDAILFRKY